MTELKQHTLLLAFITLLLLAKFIIVPIYAWQDQQLADISLLEKKQAKISAVLTAQDKVTQLNKALDSALKQSENLIFPYQEDAKFKLNQQKTLETLLSKFNLTVQHVGWQAVRSKDHSQFTSYPILIRFSGKTDQVVQFLAAAEMNTQRIEVNELNFTLKGQKANALGRITGSITLMLFMEKTPKVKLASLEPTELAKKFSKQLANQRSTQQANNIFVQASKAC